MKLIYDEWYGTVSFAQRATYRKFNVTPSEHEDLVDEFGAENHEAITKAVKRRVRDGMYRAPWPPHFASRGA